MPLAQSAFPRNTLYPGLQDHELVLNYPDVRGMAKNLYFVSHNHKENGGADDTASKYNTYEVSSLSIFLTRELTRVMIEGGNDPRLRLVLAQVSSRSAPAVS